MNIDANATDPVRNVTLSGHAERRCQQRAVRSDMLVLLLDHADVQRHVGGGSVALSLTRRRREELRKTWPDRRHDIDRLDNLVAIVARDSDTVVTVMHCDGRRGAAARRYRRQ